MHRTTNLNDYHSVYGWHSWPIEAEGDDGLRPSDVLGHLEGGGEEGGEGELLRDIVMLTDWLRDITPTVVRLARESGYSWAQVGHALGISRQGAQQRFAAVAS